MLHLVLALISPLLVN